MFVNDILIRGEAGGEEAWAPLILDRARPGDAERMTHLIASGQVRSVCDRIDEQLDDLVRARARTIRLSADELRERRAAVLDGAPAADYGRWVFYPWSARLVHLLPPAEHAELRLDRNRHKVTSDEQARLAAFAVGVVGLTAGNAAALTLALEGTCGRLKLADRGAVALPDLNRLRAGVHHLGLSRAVLAARQVHEVDPYVRVEVYSAGVDAATLDAFLDGLDAVVDACDDLALKVRLRERAREKRTPVLMEAGDRGLLEVERYDLEPHLPPFHGRLGDLCAARVEAMDDEARAGLHLAILGVETVSMRAAASVLELGRTVTAWPQLASEAALGGATVAAAVRRLALGQPLPGGRRHLDAEAVLADVGPALALSAVRGGVGRPLAGVDGRIPELVRFCVEAGAQAPSPANSQPWRFRWDGERLWVLHERSLGTSLLDPGHRAAHVALGAALENIAVAAAHRGWRAKAEPFPRPRDPSVAAAVTFAPADGPVEADAALYAQVGTRVTNRRMARRVPLEADQVAALADTARVRGARLDLLTTDEEVEEVARLVGAGERIRLLCRELHREMAAEVRWTREEAELRRDGISVEALELPPARTAALKLAARPDVAAALRELGGGGAFEEAARRSVERSSAVGLVTVGGAAAASALRGGRAVERVWLQATAMGLALHPMTALPYLFEMLDSSAATVFSGREVDELKRLRERFDALFEAAGGGTRLMFFRLGVAGAPSARSHRLPLEAVLTYGRPAMAA